MGSPPAEVAKEIAAQCVQLEGQASAVGLDLLAYLLNVAGEEAAARAAENRDHLN